MVFTEDFQPEGRGGLADVRRRVAEDLRVTQHELRELQLALESHQAEHDAHRARFATQLKNHHQHRTESLADEIANRDDQITEMDAAAIALRKSQQAFDVHQEQHLVAVARFDAQKATLRRDIERFRARLSALDNLIDAWDFEPAELDMEAADAEDDLPNTRERIRQVLLNQQGPMRMADIVKVVQDKGSTAREDSIRTVLAKMRDGGQVIRVERGLYRLAVQHLDDHDK